MRIRPVESVIFDGESETTEHEGLWITTLEAQASPATLVRRLGHDRWKQENNGWNDLTQNWAFKHGFLHACRHRPQTRLRTTGSEKGERNPVANRGLAAVSLILLLAFTLKPLPKGLNGTKPIPSSSHVGNTSASG